jgi:hypothetical protein
VLPLVYLPKVPAIWQQFLEFHQAHKAPVQPPEPPDAILVGTADSQLYAGACIYPTDGPFAVVEYWTTNPGVLQADRHKAVLAAIDGLRTYAATRNKSIFCFPRESKGLERMLRKSGFAMSPTVCLYHFPWNFTGLEVHGGEVLTVKRKKKR